MLEPKMRKAFNDLIKKYRSITLEEINTVGLNFYDKFTGEDVLNAITGFSDSSCTLCEASTSLLDSCNIPSIYKENCSICYKELNGIRCFEEENRYSYQNIAKASTPEGLLIAINEIADHIELLLAEYDFRNKLAKEE